MPVKHREPTSTSSCTPLLLGTAIRRGGHVLRTVSATPNSTRTHKLKSYMRATGSTSLRLIRRTALNPGWMAELRSCPGHRWVGRAGLETRCPPPSPSAGGITNQGGGGGLGSECCRSEGAACFQHHREPSTGLLCPGRKLHPILSTQYASECLPGPGGRQLARSSPATSICLCVCLAHCRPLPQQACAHPGAVAAPYGSTWQFSPGWSKEVK